MPVNSIDFATYLNREARMRDLYVNVTKLQKWLYICYGLHLALNDGAQLLDEMPTAREYGPFFPNVHNMQKDLKNNLRTLERRISIDDFRQFDDIIDATLRHYGDWTAQSLVDLTHEPGRAWDKTYQDGEGRFRTMPNDDILADFKEMLG
ncbi:MAG: Panacea domain-containing protein [Defluviitaleaceae bacterium]|nr:Panacea domain-containing protein [Defluviitaleaceae bacterium]